MAFEHDAIEMAHKVMKKYHTCDPYVLVNKLGYILMYANLGDINYAQRDYFKRITVITLNDQIDEYWQRFVLCHEIGHALLHRGFSTAFYRHTSGYGMVNWAEKEANLFAMQLEIARYDDVALNHMTDYRLLEAMGLDESLARYIKR
ncbi:hypothetical protein LBSG162_16950 [Lentilactobacillus buchneri subsp. silagei]|uniref:ImmA/IrrE family metallo-endopeptidase n=1 Tax=Lentilactobacillus buchneri TaxID=1581 RepID=UPI0012E570E7|nr:ImmA/IrrE family metallo-endopeptidase [Lentilactobacillus buchneri]GED92590.1 hypothetical protein LBSG162_16950 [Lentilactobacillus buchneri subsp. silagei]